MNKNNNKNLLYYILLIILLIIVLLFKKFFSFTIESILVFILLYLIIYIVTNKGSNALIGTSLIFIILFSMNYLYYKKNNVYENFDDKENFINLFKEHQDFKEIPEKTSEKSPDKEPHDQEPDDQDPTKIMDKLADKLNGGIKFNPEDLNKTKPLNHDFAKNKDENKDPRAKSQKELYELVDTIKTLQETITTLGPVLSEGRKIMDMFENFKI